jgi:nudix-type nucleoside diphosphatase (YffH/AdpP family)
MTSTQSAGSHGHLVTIRHVETLSDDYYVLRRYLLDLQRRDGTSQTITRQVCTRDDSAVILLISEATDTVVLTRQFRLPLFVRGDSDGILTELPGGLVDGDAPAEAVRREAEQETGYRVLELSEVQSAYMSPTLLTERTHFFLGTYEPGDRLSPGGGVRREGEDIEVIEVPFAEALAMVDRGEIDDARTILLLQHLKLHRATQ